MWETKAAIFGPVLMLAGFEALWRLYQMIA